MAAHEDAGIFKVDKFNYLNSLLVRAAARTLQGMQLTEHNCNAAIETLQAIFGDPQQIIAGYVDELYKLPDCTSDKPSMHTFEGLILWEWILKSMEDCSYPL